MIQCHKNVTKNQVAVKRVKLPYDENEKKLRLCEVEVLSKLDHPNILRLNHAFIDDPPKGYFEEMDERNGLERELTDFTLTISTTSSDDN